jgi:hypothetical protein
VTIHSPAPVSPATWPATAAGKHYV